MSADAYTLPEELKGSDVKDVIVAANKEAFSSIKDGAKTFFNNVLFRKEDLLGLIDGFRCDGNLGLSVVFLEDNGEKVVTLAAFTFDGHDCFGNQILVSADFNENVSLAESSNHWQDKTLKILRNNLRAKESFSKPKAFGPGPGDATFDQWLAGFDPNGALKEYPERTASGSRIKKMHVIFDGKKMKEFLNNLSGELEYVAFFPMVFYVEGGGASLSSEGNYITYLALPLNKDKELLGVEHFTVSGSMYPRPWDWIKADIATNELYLSLPDFNPV